MERPIPAFYCVYLLRAATKRRLYVGSTPDPKRRLRQHNGDATGGAKRTSSARPWEMTMIITGFPSKIAALQFEWAWQNEHITRHISESDRISHYSIERRKRGQRVVPKVVRSKRSVSIDDKLANLHLLLRVNSFSRWPLRLKFFSEDVYSRWTKLPVPDRPALKSTLQAIKPTSKEVDDPMSTTSARPTSNTHDSSPTGINLLDVTYQPLKAYVEKTTSFLESNHNLHCAVCAAPLSSEDDMILLCPHESCSATSHLQCLSREFLDGQHNLIPDKGSCPGCKHDLMWSDLVRELTLRTRGGESLRRLLKKKKTSANSVHDAVIGSDEDDEQGGEANTDLVPDGTLLNLEDDIDKIVNATAVTGKKNSKAPAKTPKKRNQTAKTSKFFESKEAPLIIENSDWDDIDDVL